MVHYYDSLSSDNKENNIGERERRISCATTAMLQYYTTVVDVKSESSIYNNYIDDHCRNIITRWRLSNHRLRIETCRYQLPRIEREDRKCYECDIMEDERHAIFVCPAFAFIRGRYELLLEKYPSVKLFLNPEARDVYDVANFLSEINDILNRR